MTDPFLSFSALPVPVPVPVAEVPHGPHSEAYFADQSEKKRALVEIRDERQQRPAWNALKEVFWTPCTSFFSWGNQLAVLLATCSLPCLQRWWVGSLESRSMHRL